jgi:hypothetical protein
MNYLVAGAAILAGTVGFLAASRVAVMIGEYLAGSYDLHDVWEDEDV